MSRLQDLGEIIDADVLIVGGGLAGLAAAIAAKDDTNTVVVVEKGFTGKAGYAKMALGMILALLPGEDLVAGIEDLKRAHDGMLDSRTAEHLLANSFECVRDLERWGINFLKDGDAYTTVPARGARYLKNIVPEEGGQGILHVLWKQALHRGVQMQNRVCVADLVTDGSAVVGAVGVNPQDGTFKIFRAPSVLLATNTIGFRGHRAFVDMVGDGPAMAYRAGARLANAEFNIVNSAPADRHFEGVGVAAHFGAVFRNARGEAFMAKYEPELKDEADVGAIAKAFALETRAGNGPFIFDFTAVDKEKLERWHRSGSSNWESVHNRRLAEYNIVTDTPEWMNAFGYTLGSVKTDFDGAGSVPGLFAAGKGRTCGIALLTGWSFCICLVEGRQAGTNARRSAAEKAGRQAQPDAATVAELKANLFAPLSREKPLSADEVTRRIQEVVFAYDVSVLKHKDRLSRALDEIQRLRDESVPRMGARDLHDLVKLRETENIVLNAEMMLRASLVREESRLGHFREDFPNRDDVAWRKWVIVEKDDVGEMRLSTEQIPD
ncbi:MAG: FAD-binding protein [Chloroflexi bacterium]|nr:FAD-binding protein [Chloroflexota bacterium]